MADTTNASLGRHVCPHLVCWWGMEGPRSATTQSHLPSPPPLRPFPQISSAPHQIREEAHPLRIDLPMIATSDLEWLPWGKARPLVPLNRPL